MTFAELADGQTTPAGEEQSDLDGTLMLDAFGTGKCDLNGALGATFMQLLDAWETKVCRELFVFDRTW